MVPMARILVVGVVFIAAPCAFAELKPTRQPMSANAAAETDFMLSSSVCRSGDRVNPLGEHRLQGSRIATMTPSSSMERTVDLAWLPWKQVSHFPVRHCEFRTGLRPVPL